MQAITDRHGPRRSLPNRVSATAGPREVVSGRTASRPNVILQAEAGKHITPPGADPQRSGTHRASGSHVVLRGRSSIRPPPLAQQAKADHGRDQPPPPHGEQNRSQTASPRVPAAALKPVYAVRDASAPGGRGGGPDRHPSTEPNSPVLSEPSHVPTDHAEAEQPQHHSRRRRNNCPFNLACLFPSPGRTKHEILQGV